jgi:hypothetical protein
MTFFADAQPSAVEAALVHAFYDGKIRTEGKCQGRNGHDARVGIDDFVWDPDRVRVGWVLDPNLDCFERTEDGKQYLFVEIYVNRQEFETWLHAQPAADAANRARAETDRVIPKRTTRPPSREKPFWPAAREIGMAWLTDNGCPARGDGNQAGLERHVAEWLEVRGHVASESAVRRHVRCWIEACREALNA